MLGTVVVVEFSERSPTVATVSLDSFFPANCDCGRQENSYLKRRKANKRFLFRPIVPPPAGRWLDKSHGFYEKTNILEARTGRLYGLRSSRQSKRYACTTHGQITRAFFKTICGRRTYLIELRLYFLKPEIAFVRMHTEIDTKSLKCIK